MRTAVALGATLLLLTIVALCPLLMCPLIAQADASDHGCCHKPHSHHSSCPPQIAPDCPYIALEKSKTQPVVSPMLAARLCRLNPDLGLEVGLAARPTYPRNAAGIYLRNRVLLI